MSEHLDETEVELIDDRASTLQETRVPATANGLDPKNRANLLEETHFKGTEEEGIALAMDIRTKLVKSMTMGGMPTKTRDIEVLNMVLGGLEDTSFKKAKLRTSVKDTETNAANSAMIAEVFKDARRRKNGIKTIDAQITEIEDKFIPDDIVPGAMDNDSIPLEIEDFVSSKERIEDI